jgi:hypothetical protein
MIQAALMKRMLSVVATASSSMTKIGHGDVLRRVSPYIDPVVLVQVYNEMRRRSP